MKIGVGTIILILIVMRYRGDRSGATPKHEKKLYGLALYTEIGQLNIKFIFYCRKTTSYT